MIVPKEIDLTIYQGASFYKEWELRDKEGNPIDMTGWSARMHIRRRKSSPDTMLELTTENGRLFINVQVDKTTYGIDLPPEDTETLTDKSGVYDLELVDLEGGVARVQEGIVTISLAVTRSIEV